MANSTPGQETHLNPHDAHKAKPKAKANGKAETKAQQKAKTEKALGTLVEPNKIVDGYIKRIESAMTITTKGAAEVVRGIVQVGKELIAAKDDERVKHGEWLPMLHRLQLGEDKAEMLMKIARNTVLSNSVHVRNLPPAIGTLNDLTKLQPHKLEAKIEDGTINALMERKDVKELLPKKPKKKKYPNEDEPEEGTTAGSVADDDETLEDQLDTTNPDAPTLAFASRVGAAWQMAGDCNKVLLPLLKPCQEDWDDLVVRTAKTVELWTTVLNTMKSMDAPVSKRKRVL